MDTGAYRIALFTVEVEINRGTQDETMRTYSLDPAGSTK